MWSGRVADESCFANRPWAGSPRVFAARMAIRPAARRKTPQASSALWKPEVRETRFVGYQRVGVRLVAIAKKIARSSALPS